MSTIVGFFESLNINIARFSIPKFGLPDFFELLILYIVIYNSLVWIKKTKANKLLKGATVFVAVWVLAKISGMTTIVFIIEHLFSVAIMALIVVFQPELRRALENLGNKNILFDFLQFDNSKVADERMSDETIEAIVTAAYSMGAAKTGALIVIERDNSLAEYEKTGITINGEVTSQLLVNIFEHNTPLHDGAAIISGDKILSATCYLPLSSNRNLSKELGTRHRAAVGISEATDSFTIVVSEETGKVSTAFDGELTRNISREELTKKLQSIQDKVYEENRYFFWKGRSKREKSSN